MSEQWVVAPEEWYPVLCRDEEMTKVDGEWGRKVTLTDEDAAFVTQAFADMEKAQAILQAAYDAARGRLNDG